MRKEETGFDLLHVVEANHPKIARIWCLLSTIVFSLLNEFLITSSHHCEEDNFEIMSDVSPLSPLIHLEKRVECVAGLARRDGERGNRRMISPLELIHSSFSSRLPVLIDSSTGVTIKGPLLTLPVISNRLRCALTRRVRPQ
ncbi:hypothetical protein PFISCL1PPCAC_21799 [Pristionchus fissidentatus]|uniref:Uncharacterized protein n=1 Tax=Pristionchus fissidentatus TaxID=1538716 RepID=A0AAV5WF40_9BILA|nr:hypothetical protein PFISCL1PPCAC_21799 [Pristionchus fissidentatus]